MSLNSFKKPRCIQCSSIKWKEETKDSYRVRYIVGKTNEGEYFWAYEIKNNGMDILEILNCPDLEEELYGGFNYKSLKGVLNSIKTDDLFEDEPENHQIYLWAKEQFQLHSSGEVNHNNSNNLIDLDFERGNRRR